MPCQGRVNYSRYELYLAICQKSEKSGYIHWMIMMIHPGAERWTWFHSTGYKDNRSLDIDENKRFNSWGIESTHYLGRIPVCAAETVGREARNIPLQSCQTWACYLMLRLELRGMLPENTYHHFMHHYKHRRNEDYGPGDDIKKY